METVCSPRCDNKIDGEQASHGEQAILNSNDFVEQQNNGGVTSVVGENKDALPESKEQNLPTTPTKHFQEIPSTLQQDNKQTQEQENVEIQQVNGEENVIAPTTQDVPEEKVEVPNAEFDEVEVKQLEDQQAKDSQNLQDIENEIEKLKLEQLNREYAIKLAEQKAKQLEEMKQNAELAAAQHAEAVNQELNNFKPMQMKVVGQIESEIQNAGVREVGADMIKQNIQMILNKKKGISTNTVKMVKKKTKPKKADENDTQENMEGGNKENDEEKEVPNAEFDEVEVKQLEDQQAKDSQNLQDIENEIEKLKLEQLNREYAIKLAEQKAKQLEEMKQNAELAAAQHAEAVNQELNNFKPIQQKKGKVVHKENNAGVREVGADVIKKNIMVLMKKK